MPISAIRSSVCPRWGMFGVISSAITATVPKRNSRQAYQSANKVFVHTARQPQSLFWTKAPTPSPITLNRNHKHTHTHTHINGHIQRLRTQVIPQKCVSRKKKKKIKQQQNLFLRTFCTAWWGMARFGPLRA